MTSQRPASSGCDKHEKGWTRMSTINGNGNGAVRWVGLGNSRATEPVTAGREAAEQALAGRPAKCLIVFASPEYDHAELVGFDPSLGRRGGRGRLLHGPARSPATARTTP